MANKNNKKSFDMGYFQGMVTTEFANIKESLTIITRKVDEFNNECSTHRKDIYEKIGKNKEYIDKTKGISWLISIITTAIITTLINWFWKR